MQHVLPKKNRSHGGTDGGRGEGGGTLRIVVPSVPYLRHWVCPSLDGKSIARLGPKFNIGRSKVERQIGVNDEKLEKTLINQQTKKRYQLYTLQHLKF